MEWVRLSPFQYIYSSFNSGMFDIDLLTSEPLVLCTYIFFNGALRDCNMLIQTILVEPIMWKHAMMACVGMVWPKWTNTHECTIVDGWVDGWMNDAWTRHFQIGWMDGWMMHGQDTFKLDGWMMHGPTYVWRVKTLSLKLGSFVDSTHTNVK
jgi:hypothetical protein